MLDDAQRVLFEDFVEKDEINQIEAMANNLRTNIHQMQASEPKQEISNAIYGQIQRFDTIEKVCACFQTVFDNQNPGETFFSQLDFFIPFDAKVQIHSNFSQDLLQTKNDQLDAQLPSKGHALRHSCDDYFPKKLLNLAYSFSRLNKNAIQYIAATGDKKRLISAIQKIVGIDGSTDTPEQQKSFAQKLGHRFAGAQGESTVQALICFSQGIECTLQAPDSVKIKMLSNPVGLPAHLSPEKALISFLDMVFYEVLDFPKDSATKDLIGAVATKINAHTHNPPHNLLQDTKTFIDNLLAHYPGKKDFVYEDIKKVLNVNSWKALKQVSRMADSWKNLEQELGMGLNTTFLAKDPTEELIETLSNTHSLNCLGAYLEGAKLGLTAMPPLKK